MIISLSEVQAKVKMMLEKPAYGNPEGNDDASYISIRRHASVL